MIIQPEHEHEQDPTQQQKQLEAPKDTKSQASKTPRLEQPPRKAEASVIDIPKPPGILTQMLHGSLAVLAQSTSDQIRQKMKYMEQKVHFSFSQGPNQYLKHLRAKRKPETEEVVRQIIDIKNWLACNNIRNETTKLYERGEVANNLKGQISNKLMDMKKSMMSLSSIDKKANAYIENLLEFRKKNYWLNQNETTKNVKTFLSKMKRIQSEQKKRYESQLVKNQYRMQVSLQKQKQKEHQTRKKMHSLHLEKQIQWRKERERQFEEDRRKKQQIESYLQKYHQDKPMHVKLEQHFIKNVLEPMEEERQKKLDEIRKEHQPIDMEQIQEHQQKYQEYKQSLMEQHRKRSQDQLENTTQLEQNLKELYHSRFHSKIEPRFYNSLKQGLISARKKVKDYSQEILENHRPRIDPAKRQKIQQTIRQLELKEDKAKRRVVQEDGSVIIEERPQISAYRIGVQYLQKLKEQSQGKPRKREDRSASMLDMPTTRVRKIDYLRENKPKVQLKRTSGDWKKVVGDASFSPRQKFEFIMEQAAVMQEKSLMKEAQMRSYKKGERAMQLKGEMDKFYAESVAAKMVVLKDVIMKQ